MKFKILIVSFILSVFCSRLSANYDSGYFIRQQKLLYSDSFHADVNSLNQKLFLDSLYNFIYIDSMVEEYAVEKRIELVFLLYSKSFSYLKYRWQATIKHKIENKDSILLKRIQLTYPMLVDYYGCSLDSAIYNFIKVNAPSDHSLLKSIETNRYCVFYRYFNSLNVLLEKEKKFEDIKFADYHLICEIQRGVLRNINVSKL